MGYQGQAVLRWRIGFAINAACIYRNCRKIALLVFAVMAGPGTVQADDVSKNPAYVVGNDRGGLIRNRLIELRNLRASGRRVEIRGDICYSTCTMLLGLPKTCVSPDTTFGFHGPSKSGKRLAPDRFEYYSRVISQYYPAQLQNWYMSTGRNRLRGMYRIKGEEIVRMGVRSC